MHKRISEICVLICWALAAEVLSQDQDYFINPPHAGPDLDFSDNPVYALGSVVNISFCQFDETTSAITLWQQGKTDDDVTSEYIFTGLSEEGCISELWSVSTIQNLCKSNIFFLIAENATGWGIVSHYFTITNEDGKLCAPSTSENSTSANSSLSTTALSTATPSSKKSVLPIAASIGISVACGLLACLAACLGAFYFWMRRQRKRKLKVGEEINLLNSQAVATDYTGYPRDQLKHEMDSQWRHEQKHDMDRYRSSMLQKHELDTQRMTTVFKQR